MMDSILLADALSIALSAVIASGVGFRGWSLSLCVVPALLRACCAA